MQNPWRPSPIPGIQQVLAEHIRHHAQRPGASHRPSTSSVIGSVRMRQAAPAIQGSHHISPRSPPLHSVCARRRYSVAGLALSMPIRAAGTDAGIRRDAAKPHDGIERCRCGNCQCLLVAQQQSWGITHRHDECHQWHFRSAVAQYMHSLHRLPGSPTATSLTEMDTRVPEGHDQMRIIEPGPSARVPKITEQHRQLESPNCDSLVFSFSAMIRFRVPRCLRERQRPGAISSSS